MVRTALRRVRDLLDFVALACSSHSRLAAEHLFLRKQLACYLGRKVKPRRVDDATRITLVVLARFINWRRVLTIVQPDTLVQWHRQGFRLLWRTKSRSRGRPRIPPHLQQLIATMADNRGRPHASLGPGIPEQAAQTKVARSTGHELPHRHRVAARPILGGLHHEYRLEPVAA
jgi:hypothetical protein